jgi:hypothetical protein
MASLGRREAGGDESGLEGLRVVGAGNGEGARCGICGEARCVGWGCTSRGEKDGGGFAVGVGASRTTARAGLGA